MQLSTANGERASAGGRAGREADSRPLPRGGVTRPTLRGAGSPRSDGGNLATQRRRFPSDVRPVSRLTHLTMANGH